MSAPAVYTEKTLADFMHVELGKLATVLGYAPGAGDAGSYAEAVNESILRYGVATIDLATDIRKLRGLARLEAWKKAVDDLAAHYTFQSDGNTFDREQMFTNAELNLQRCLTLALEWDPGYIITVTKVRPVHDPYRYLPEDEDNNVRTL